MEILNLNKINEIKINIPGYHSVQQKSKKKMELVKKKLLFLNCLFRYLSENNTQENNLFLIFI